MANDRHICAEIRRQTTLEDAAAVLADSAHALDWDLVGFHVDINATDLPRSHTGEFLAEIMGWPSECVAGWRRFRIGEHCPIAAQCGRVADPFPFTCDERDRSWFDGEFSAEHVKVMQHYGRYIASGIAIPVHLRAGGTGYVSWSTQKRERLDPDEIRLSSLFFISHAFIRYAEQLLDDDSGIHGRLTARERECLTWAARGKSEEEIGHIISRSRDTVHFHLRNATMKLDAGNRTHAVAIACTRGLISLR